MSSDKYMHIEGASEEAVAIRAFWDLVHAVPIEAYAYVLYNLDLGGWDAKKSIPESDALAQQKELSLEPVPKFWVQCMRDSCLYVSNNSGQLAEDTVAWDSEVTKHRLFKGFELLRGAPRAGQSAQTDYTSFMTQTKKFFAPLLDKHCAESRRRLHADGPKDTVQTIMIRMPSLSECRRVVRRGLGPKFDLGGAAGGNGGEEGGANV
jgi:hypothetical protein